MRIGAVAAAGGAAAVALAVADTAYRTRYWGATARETSLVLPGDDLVPEPADSVTRAVTVHAPAEEVWRWLVEIGRVRGGVEVVPGRSVVLMGGPRNGPRDAICSLHVLPMDPPVDRQTGQVRCRLLTRSRTARTSVLSRVAAAVLEPVTLVLTRRMLLGVKERAERSASRSAVSTG